MASQQRPNVNDEMFEVAYQELRRLAKALGRQGRDVTLTPTALVHEAYIKLTQGGRFEAESTQHLTYTVVRAMKQILLDAARRRATTVHGGGLQRVSLDEALGRVATVTPTALLAVGLALDDLAAANPMLARAFELQYFGGFQVVEIASLMDISEKRAQRLLRLARAYLAHTLTVAPGPTRPDPA